MTEAHGEPGASQVMSGVLCQEEKNADSLVVLYVCEHGEEDFFGRGSIGELACRPGSAADFAEAEFDSIGGTCGFAPIGVGEAGAGEQLVEIALWPISSLEL